MRTQGIYLNVSRGNDDLPEMIEEYSGSHFRKSELIYTAKVLGYFSFKSS